MILQNLYDVAKTKNIPIIKMQLPLVKGISTLTDNNCYIGIDNSENITDAEEAVILAHELGHCIKGAFYNIYSSCDIKSRHEYRADKWAIQKLVPLDKLRAAIKNGLAEVYELSEYFCVTESFIKKSLLFYESKGELKRE